ncbi:MAG: SAM-dependent methyltransferase [Proteobacteria bacterium]|nr:SAM-dependent methyltransferase [Pseudomonadota bacterium]
MSPPVAENKSSALIANLPAPDEAARAHSLQLTDKIRAKLDAGDGLISFRCFMEMALYEPGLGYYSAGARKIGADGDFITAPEISSLFSFCLARQCEQIMHLLGGSSIMELGAGTGTMAGDVLAELGRRNCLPEKYFILETSADLRQRQQQLLTAKIPELLNRVEWLESLPDKSFKGVILANEVLDALPVERVVMIDDTLYELQVGWRDGAFCWDRKLADSNLADHIDVMLKQLNVCWSDGYCTEINTGVAAWIASLADILEQGVMIFVDYGYSGHEYYHPQRSDGTLLCHYRHHVHTDPFSYIGLQDITASVDFTAVAQAAVTAELDVKGFTTQAHFLLSCGLDEFVSLSAADDKKLLQAGRQAKLLILPGEMGERFKVIALGRNIQEKLMGFQMADHRNRL